MRIDFAGTVEASDDDRYAPGDKVGLTGWRVGDEACALVAGGGYAEQVVQYYGLEDFKARIWIAHQRYPGPPPSRLAENSFTPLNVRR